MRDYHDWPIASAVAIILLIVLILPIDALPSYPVDRTGYAGWLLAFTLSLDDLIIATFVSGPGATTMPMLIYSRVRLGLRPDINALAMIIILVVAVGVLLAGWIMLRQQKQRELELQMSSEDS